MTQLFIVTMILLVSMAMSHNNYDPSLHLGLTSSSSPLKSWLISALKLGARSGWLLSRPSSITTTLAGHVA